MAGMPPPPGVYVPADAVRGVIDKLAGFVARRGDHFEQMTREKQQNNPRFAFLFGGPDHAYYRWVLALLPRCYATPCAHTRYRHTLTAKQSLQTHATDKH